MLTRSLFLSLANNKTAEHIVKSNPLSRRMTSRFVAGESISDVVTTVKNLNALGADASVDLLGESVTKPEEVEQTVSTYLQLIQAVRTNNLRTTVSVKLTALGLDIDANLCRASMIRLLEAANPDIFIQIDMEGTPHTERTLELFYALRQDYTNVGAVIQAYLFRSEADIEKLISIQARVRLCKGAYNEPPSLAFPLKTDVDTNYLKLMHPLIEKGNYPGFATHDPIIIEQIKAYAKSQNLPNNRFEFQMLYGIRRDLQTQLVQNGYNLTVYTPFGTHWYPYFMRRLAERPANIWFVLKSLLKG